MDRNVKDALQVGSFINTWGKIVTVFGTAIVSCTFAYYMLLSHQHRLDDLEEKHEKDIQALRDDYKKQYGIIEEKSQQKFEQGMKVAIEMKVAMDKIQERLNAEEKELSYLKGQHYGFKY